MYLSRLVLNPRSSEVRRDLADCQALHRRILSGFGQAPPEIGSPGAREHFGVLHRVETDPQTGDVRVLVQSRSLPNWSCLPERYLIPGDNGDHIEGAPKPVGDYHAKLVRDGATLRFRLRANVTRKIDTKTGPDGKRRSGKRVELREDLTWRDGRWVEKPGGHASWEWLGRKGEQAGFRLLTVQASGAFGTSGSAGTIPNANATSMQKLVGRRPNKAVEEGVSQKTSQLTLGSIIFDGLLEITNAELFRGALDNGVGPGKAYGFGLLSIAPASAAAVDAVIVATPR